MTRYAIGLGGNRGDIPVTLALAARRLTDDGLVRIEAASPLVRTPAVGGPTGQGDFTNGVWIVATDLGPHQLLMRLLAVESACGRTRTVTWGPRTCDLDLLLAEDGHVIHTPVLTLPHPRLHQRDFVLAPLIALVPHWMVPGKGTVASLAALTILPPAPVTA